MLCLPKAIFEHMKVYVAELVGYVVVSGWESCSLVEAVPSLQNSVKKGDSVFTTLAWSILPALNQWFMYFSRKGLPWDFALPLEWRPGARILS